MSRPDATPSSSATPERLLERYQAGDDAAFGQPVARYEDKLYGYLVRLTGDPHLAEDVFSETFVKVAKSAASFDGRSTFSTWLYRIARNAAFDELRRRGRDNSVQVGSGDLDSLKRDGGETPLEKMTREELGEKIRAALLRLPGEQREAFLLKEEADLDFREIGVVLGCGRETAKSRFRLAVGKLRELLR